jgi:uncharacterized repeat protein (TIGR03803 family)
MNRRDFLDLLIQSGLAAGAASRLPDIVTGIGVKAARIQARGVAIILPADERMLAAPACRWALDQLQQSLAGRDISVRLLRRTTDLRADEIGIVVDRETRSSDPATGRPAGAEAVTVGARVTAAHALFDAIGSDDRGLAYALTEAADIVSSTPDPIEGLLATSRRQQTAATPVRSVMRMFSSDIEDKGWFNDRGFWRDYLSMLATERFNRFNLAFGLGYDFARELKDTYLYFAYPFLLAVPGYDVRATNLPNAERDRNLEMLRFISDETVARGLEFQIGIWTHAYVWQNSPDVNHVIEGLPANRHADYSRDALALLLKSCPSISGVTLRIHGESGVAEGSYDFWKTVFDGAVRSGRPMRLDLHAKGIDQPMIDAALATGLPVMVSPKFWAEHMGLPYHQAAIRPTELPVAGRVVTGLMALSTGERSFTRYGYGDLLTEDRKYSVLHLFTTTDGRGPQAPLVQGSDGYFYGTTVAGGQYGLGTIFRITSRGDFKVLYQFDGTKGKVPEGPLIQAGDGDFYGVTVQGGTLNQGVAFKMTPGGGFTVLHVFTGQFIPDGTAPTRMASDGVQPSGGLTQAADGDFYGTTGGGGAAGGGTAFMIAADGTYRQLFTFAGNAEGSSPTATLVLATDGNLYGTAQYGGQFNKGSIFRMTLAR